MKTIEQICKSAKENCLYIQGLKREDKDKMLNVIAVALVKECAYILENNALDLLANSDKPKYLLDRLTLNPQRVNDIADGLNKIALLPDYTNEIIEAWTVPNGLEIKKVRVPLGVIGIIYEARPNVTVDVAGLCIKSGNAVVLRGSKDAINSNKAIVQVIKEAVKNAGYNPEFIQLIEDTSRESAQELMRCRKYVDVLIPRGSKSLIDSVVENSLVPVIETGAGNCHAYVHESADFDIAEQIILNGKLSRPSVCNALESLLIDRAVSQSFIPRIAASLIDNGAEVVGCPESVKIYPKISPASEEDYYAEFLALKISVKIVSDYKEAIEHINKYSTAHSDVIIAKDTAAIESFLNGVDSAAVYANASSRFTDGFEFGFGAEMGISTQKLHARGPIGLKQLMSEKYTVYGQGQIRK